MVLCLLNVFDDVLVKPFMAHRSIVTFDIGILLRLAGLNMLNADLTFFRPRQQFAADIFRAIVDPNSLRLAPPFDNPVQAPDNSFGG